MNAATSTAAAMHFRQVEDRDQKQREIDMAWAIHQAKYQLCAAQLVEKFESQDGLCFYCGRLAILGEIEDIVSENEVVIDNLPASRRRKARRRMAATREHLIRKCDGGTDDDDNIVMACAGCNNGRQDAPVDVHRAHMRCVHAVDGDAS